jgi:hypothetical protein
MSIQEEIQKTAAQLLAEGKADIVIGFSAGSLPMRAAPCFITEPDAAKKLVWNSYCSNNLAVYLTGCFAPDPRARGPKSNLPHQKWRLLSKVVMGAQY